MWCLKYNVQHLNHITPSNLKFACDLLVKICYILHSIQNRIADHNVLYQNVSLKMLVETGAPFPLQNGMYSAFNQY